MKEKPILFSGPMVRAILEGRKTQTRRVCKDQPSIVFATATMNPRFPTGKFYCDEYDVPMFDKCPYGQAGDRLWVKETFCCRIDDGVYQFDSEWNHLCLYRADGNDVTKDDGNGGVELRKDGREASPWKPSIFMPRKFSRLTLEIVSVRVERLQEISEADAVAEGVKEGETIQNAQDDSPQYRDYSREDGCTIQCAVQSYETLWESINGPGSWAKNPWVWVIEFKRI